MEESSSSHIEGYLRQHSPMSATEEWRDYRLESGDRL